MFGFLQAERSIVRARIFRLIQAGHPARLEKMERVMKNLLFVALTVLSLRAGLVTARAANFHNGSTAEDTLSATRRQQTGHYSG
jgi:hypothetical protein